MGPSQAVREVKAHYDDLSYLALQQHNYEQQITVPSTDRPAVPTPFPPLVRNTDGNLERLAHLDTAPIDTWIVKYLRDHSAKILEPIRNPPEFRQFEPATAMPPGTDLIPILRLQSYSTDHDLGVQYAEGEESGILDAHASLNHFNEKQNSVARSRVDDWRWNVASNAFVEHWKPNGAAVAYDRSQKSSSQSRNTIMVDGVDADKPSYAEAARRALTALPGPQDGILGLGAAEGLDMGEQLRRDAVNGFGTGGYLVLPVEPDLISLRDKVDQDDGHAEGTTRVASQSDTHINLRVEDWLYGHTSESSRVANGMVPNVNAFQEVVRRPAEKRQKQDLQVSPGAWPNVSESRADSVKQKIPGTRRADVECRAPALAKECSTTPVAAEQGSAKNRHEKGWMKRRFSMMCESWWT